MKRGKIILLGLILVLFVLLSSFGLGQQKDCLYYFYGEGCPHCAIAGSYLDKIELKYSGLEIHRFEIYHNLENLNSLQEYFEAYEVPLKKQGVPVIFLGDSYLVGSKAITNYFEGTIASNEGEECPSLDKEGGIGIIGEGDPKHLIDTLTFGVITGAALADSINPCAIAVLLILLGALLAVKGKKSKRLLLTGIAFIVGLYLAYFLFGMGLLATLTLTGAGFYFYKVIGVLAILIGLFNIKDYFWYGKVFLMEIPLKWRGKLRKLLQGVTSPAGAFVVGFVVSLFELPCTGGSYLVILGLLAEKATKWAAMPLLVYYNLVFVLPLVIILLAVYFSRRKIEEYKKDKKLDIHGEIEKWRQKNLRLLHLIAGVIMVVLGMVILFFV